MQRTGVRRQFGLSAAMIFEPAKIIGQLADGGPVIGGFHAVSFEFQAVSFKFDDSRPAPRVEPATLRTERAFPAQCRWAADGEGFERHACWFAGEGLGYNLAGAD